MCKTIIQKLWDRTEPERIKALEKYWEVDEYIRNIYIRYTTSQTTNWNRRVAYLSHSIAMRELSKVCHTNTIFKFKLRRSIRKMDKVKSAFDLRMSMLIDESNTL